MKTSKQWWDETKSNEVKLLTWLRKQFHGEHTAAERIERYCAARLTDGDKRLRVLKIIADQERQHAGWVGDLLRARGIEPVRLDKTERYWDRVLGRIESFEHSAAVAHHAEVMRLERIRVIAEDQTAPEDIRTTFARILQDEEFHAMAFGEMAGEGALVDTYTAHLEGAAAIGFVSMSEAV